MDRSRDSVSKQPELAFLLCCFTSYVPLGKLFHHSALVFFKVKWRNSCTHRVAAMNK